jgi:glycine cleavage system H lipoate-binding protein
MACPFLREAQVKYCQTAAVRKLIPLVAAGRADEKCGSSAHVSCAVYRAHPDVATARGPCPYLRESLMQYCSAAPVAKMIPYSESQLTRCGGSAHRYCELYLAMAHPETGPGVGAIAMPEWLSYSSNHMWFDPGQGGLCHIGIDAFLARVLGTVERISYIWEKGILRRPAAVLTAGGVDFEVVFPNPLHLTRCNLYLRADPARLTAEPYTGGWLFEGTPVDQTNEHLLSGAAARQWMQAEERRMSDFLQDLSGARYAADGGTFTPGVATVIERDQALTLFHEFFLPEWGGFHNR